MAAGESDQIDALYKKYQTRTSRGKNTGIDFELESFSRFYSSQLARCHVPASESTYLASPSAYPWIVQKTITYSNNLGNGVYNDPSVNNIIPFYDDPSIFSIKVGSTPLNKSQYTLDYDVGTLVVYVPTQGTSPTIKFCQYVGSYFTPNQLLRDGSDSVIVNVDASGFVGIGMGNSIRPTAQLDVSGTTTLRGTTTVTGKLAVGSIQADPNSSLTISGRSFHQNIVGSQYNSLITSVVDNSSSNVGYMLESVFYNGSFSSGSPLVLNTNTGLSGGPGNVGIGTNTPTTKLDVSGTTTLRGATTVTTGGLTVQAGGTDISGTTTLRGATTVTTGGLTVQAGGATVTGSVSVSSNVLVSNRLGVGVSNPGYALDVSGETRLRNTVYVGSDPSTNEIRFNGTWGDGIGEGTYTRISERIYTTPQNTEKSELLLYKGNDPAGDATSGPDRVRVKAGEFRVQTYSTYQSPSMDAYTDGSDGLIVNPTGTTVAGTLTLTTKPYQRFTNIAGTYNEGGSSVSDFNKGTTIKWTTSSISDSSIGFMNTSGVWTCTKDGVYLISVGRNPYYTQRWSIVVGRGAGYVLGTGFGSGGGSCVEQLSNTNTILVCASYDGSQTISADNAIFTITRLF